MDWGSEAYRAALLGPVALYLDHLRRVLGELAEMLAWLRAAGDVSDDVYVGF